MGYNNPDDLDEDEEPLTERSTDMEAWEYLFELLEEEIFFDHDFAMSFDDLTVEDARAARRQFTIADDYYSAIPDDPKEKEAIGLLHEIIEFTDKLLGITWDE